MNDKIENIKELLEEYKRESKNHSAPPLLKATFYQVVEDIEQILNADTEQQEQKNIDIEAVRIHWRAQNRALTRLRELCYQNGYTTWDTDSVKLDEEGRFDIREAIEWEKVHGHDIRLPCYPEYSCQLYIDPKEIIEILEADKY